MVARVYLDMLRSRKSRREEPLGVHVPDPIVSRAGGVDPEHEALPADSVGLARPLIFDTLAPAERLAFVLHDMFDVRFKEIGPWSGILPPRPGRSPAPRAAGCRERPRLPTPISPASEKLLTPSSLPHAAEDFDALVAVLDPDVVVRAVGRAGGRVVGGPRSAGRG